MPDRTVLRTMTTTPLPTRRLPKPRRSPPKRRLQPAYGHPLRGGDREAIEHPLMNKLTGALDLELLVEETGAVTEARVAKSLRPQLDARAGGGATQCPGSVLRRPR
jgi:hypothetical protein